MHPRNQSYGKFVDRSEYFSEGGRRQGKTLLMQYALKFKIMEMVRSDLPKEPFVLQFGFKEIVTWLPTGEVTSTPFKLTNGTKLVAPIKDDWFYNLWMGNHVPPHSEP